MKSHIHLLMISVDGAILKQGSTVVSRMEHFGTLVDGIDIVLVGAPSPEISGVTGTISLKNNLRVHPIRSSFKVGAAIQAIIAAKKLSQPNTVIVTQDPFELGMIGVFTSWFTGRPLNVQVHIDFFSSYFRQESIRQRFQALIAPFVLFRAHSIRVVSEKIATYLRDSLGISASKITIAPVFVDVRTVQNIPVTTDLHVLYPQFDWIVLVAARYVKQKNIRLAIEAFEQFVKTHPKAGLVIAGSGPEEPVMKRIIEERGLRNSVVVGVWTNEFVSLMKTSDVFLMSSDYEGWGMTIVEASAVAKPIIMTKVGCANEFLIHEKSGLTVGTRDPKAIAAALDKLYENRAFAVNLGQEAKRRADTYMTQDESDMLMIQSWESALG